MSATEFQSAACGNRARGWSGRDFGPPLSRGFAPRRARCGSTLVVVLLATIAISALCVAMLSSSTTLYANARARIESVKAFWLVEGGMDFTLSQLANDPYWAARDAARFPTVNADGSFESDWLPLGKGAGTFQAHVTYATETALPMGWAGPGLPAGWKPHTPVVFADRGASPAYDVVIVNVRARYSGAERASEAVLKREFKAFGAAILSDAAPRGDAGAGIPFARDTRQVVFSGSKLYVYGGIRANGGVFREGSATPLTEENASSLLSGFRGTLAANLYATGEELPDYTAPGKPVQLFDFPRLESAALAGAGSWYGSLADFAGAMNAANAARVPLEGIVFVRIDAEAEGPFARIKQTGSGSVPGGINVRGSLVLHVVNAPDPLYGVTIQTPLNVNAAPLDAGFNPADPATFATGWPPAIEPARDPRLVAGFPKDADLPAVAISNGTLEITRGANVSGLVYSPSFLVIDDAAGERMFLTGAVLAGAGAFLNGGGDPQPLVLAFDPATIDSLFTAADAGKAPVIEKYAIVK